MRAWAVTEGITVPAKGILKASLYEEYAARFGEAAAALLDAPVTPEPDPVTLEEHPAPPAGNEDSCVDVHTGADGSPLVWTVTEAPPSEGWTVPTEGADGRRRCTACYDLVATLSSRDECDGCVAVRAALQRVRPPSVEDAARAYARALTAHLDTQEAVDAAHRVLRAAIRAEPR